MSKCNTPPATQTCPAVGSQSAAVCLPVTICPYATTGPATVHCCGKPTVDKCCERCKGKPCGSCEFTITQVIRVDVPVEFGATVKTGETFVECICRDGDGGGKEEEMLCPCCEADSID